MKSKRDGRSHVREVTVCNEGGRSEEGMEMKGGRKYKTEKEKRESYRKKNNKQKRKTRRGIARKI